MTARQPDSRRLIGQLGFLHLIAVVLLAWTVFTTGSALRGFIDNQNVSNAQAQCRQRVGAEAQRVRDLRDIEQSEEIAEIQGTATFNAAINEARDRGEAIPSEQYAELRARLDKATKHAERVRFYNANLTQLAAINTTAAMSCAEDPTFTVPQPLTTTAP